MTLNTQLTNLAVDTEADAMSPLLDAGFLNIYDGAQPATGDTAITTQVKLAGLTFGVPAFGASVAGVITANAITSASADDTGTATWFRCYRSDGVTAVFDGSVGTSGANCVLNSVAISVGATVSCTAFTHTIAKSTSGF